MIRTLRWPLLLAAACLVAAQGILWAEQGNGPSTVGDPQIRTDHPWFPGELSCSTFERLFETQAKLYQRETGRDVTTDEDKAIASWYWRNLNYYHAYCPREAFWADKISGEDESPRDAVLDYWTGLFGYGFSLCYTTHQQYTAEMEKLLGHGRSRSLDVPGHTTFEVFLKDAPYGAAGDWALLDQDISTIVFDDPLNPKRLISLADIAYAAHSPGSGLRPYAERESILDNSTAPEGNRGWFKSGLYFPNTDTSDATNSDALGSCTNILSTAPLSGYAAAPPIVSIKCGETIRRYLKPGLGGQTYVYWGPNYFGLKNHSEIKIPGPSRDRAWASQPERMYRATRDTDLRLARYGNVVYTYQPNFADDTYRDGVIAEDEDSVTFYFYSPYAVAATPPKDTAKRLWAILSTGCTNGLVISAEESSDLTLQVSTNNRTTWSEKFRLGERLDITDWVKGHHSYHLRLNVPPNQLTKTQITMRTVCMANDRLMPHLKSHGTTVSFGASGRAVFAAGPNVDQASPYIISGGFGTDRVEMRVPSPNEAPLLAVHATAIVSSGLDPDDEIKYQIDCSTDNGASWKPIVADWRVETFGYQASDGQTDDGAAWSFCFGNLDISESESTEVRIRFSNDGGIAYERAEVYLVYRAESRIPVLVTFDWNEQVADRILKKSAFHTFDPDYPSDRTNWPSDRTNWPGDRTNWALDTGDVVQTNWVQMQLAR